jgi:hypothetical protein
MMNDYVSILGITPLTTAARLLGSTQRDLMKNDALVIREINGKFFVEIDSLKKFIETAPIVTFDNGGAT